MHGNMVQGRGVGKEKRSLKQYPPGALQGMDSTYQLNHDVFAATNASISKSFYDLNEDSSSRTNPREARQ